MPKQISGVDVADNGDGSVTITIGDNGYRRDKAAFLDTKNLDQSHVRQNCRLAFLIGNYAQPDSLEFLNGVNKGTAGLEAKFGNVKIESVTLQDHDSQTFMIEFTVKTGVFAGQTFGIPISVDDISADSQDPTVIIDNIGSFLRKSNKADISAATLALIRAQQFWY